MYFYKFAILFYRYFNPYRSSIACNSSIFTMRVSTPAKNAQAIAAPAPSPILQTIGIILYADYASCVEEIQRPATKRLFSPLGIKQR